MAVQSTLALPLGTLAPDFQLPNVVTGELSTRTQWVTAKALLVMFICRHCPYVVHVLPELIRLTRDYQSKGLAVIAISSNDAIQYPDDAPAKLREMALELPFPVLYDESQEVARAYTAACTPDFFLFDAAGCLTYRGRLDESTPGNGRPLTGKDLRAAVEAVLDGHPPTNEPLPSTGCSIKWRHQN